MNRHFSRSAVVLFTLVTAAVAIAADTYPSRPVRLVVPFAPGGTTDLVARVVSQKIQAAFGQPMVVENRAGAGGVIGATETAKATPDGYNLGVATVSTIATAPAMEPNVTYDPINDFTPIINVAATPNVITVNPQFPARDFAGFIAELKKNPDKYSYASTGTGSITHMQMELFKLKTGVSMVHVPYKGGGPALTDEIAGHVLVMMDNLPSSLPYIQQGKVIAIAVASERRVPALPNVPTLAEVGVPEANRMAFYGIYGPKGLPADVVTKVHDAVKKTLEDREVRERIEATGSFVIANTPAEFAKQIKSEYETYKKLAVDQKLKPE